MGPPSVYPGASGAGALIEIKGRKGKREISYALGHGTNNLAEIWAIGGAIEKIKEDYEGDSEVHVFSDSLYAINCIKGEWYSRDYFEITERIKEMIRLLGRKVSLLKVAGHADILENDVADELAKKGAHFSEVNFIEFDFRNLSNNYSFNFAEIEDNTTG